MTKESNTLDYIKVLPNTDIQELAKLGNDISACLRCNINEHGVACCTDRMELLNCMIKYLKIHDCIVLSPKAFKDFKKRYAINEQ